MKLIEGLVIIEKDKTKGLRADGWPRDYLHFHNGILKYYDTSNGNNIKPSFYDNWWDYTWEIIDIDTIDDVVERVDSALSIYNIIGGPLLKDIRRLVDYIKKERCK